MFLMKIIAVQQYHQQAEYHFLNDPSYWKFEEYIIDMGDTIWVDQECYNDWCICIDECKAGLCCKFLR